MHLVAGSNLFGQWFSQDNIFTEFRAITTESKSVSDFNLDRAKLVHISWSYNIFEMDSKFYISGTWGGKENQLKTVTLPEEFDCSVKHIVGNDYKLFLVCERAEILWVMDLESEHVKKIYLNIETPIQPKKKRMDGEIVKLSVGNDLLICLTSEGAVYSGLLPSYVDTSHCIGRVTDVQCGYEHCLLLTDVGRVYSWGNGRRLQLGHGDVNNIELPTEIEALAGIKIVKIKAGGWHSLALSESKDLYAWGWNDTGQLGIKSLDHLNKEQLQSFPVPTLVDLFDENNKEISMDVKDIACGSKHSAILLEDNTVWTTGCNNYGQLGLCKSKYTQVKYFIKSYYFVDKAILMCGPWCTVIIPTKDGYL